MTYNEFIDKLVIKDNGNLTYSKALIIKRCVVCDAIISSDHQYTTNHYLCGSTCSELYGEL